MTNIATAARHISATLIQRLLATLLLSSVLMITAVAQGTPTPPGLASGAPAGSYALSDLENINLFNGRLSFGLPLLKIGGRGGAGYTMMIQVVSPKWVVRHIPHQFGTIHVPQEWGQNAFNYLPGRMEIRQSGFESTCIIDQVFPHTYYSTSLTRLTFTTPDGTEFELRDQLTGGKPLPTNWFPCVAGTPVYPQRGSVFVTADGTAATFISDTPLHDVVAPGNGQIFVVSGHLTLRDGTRYRIDNNQVSWMRDRNGNKLSFTYQDFSLTEITDSLNRRVTIAYSAPPNNINYDQITYRGFGGETRTIRVHYTSLSQALRADYSPQQALSGEQLFPELNGANFIELYDPGVVSSVELPDGRRYRFYYNHYRELARVELPTGGAIEYDHTPGSGVGEIADEIFRRALARRVYPNGGTGSAFERKTTYHYTVNHPATTTTVVSQLNQSGDLLSREKHYFHGTPWQSFFLGGTSYPTWQEGKEYQTDLLDTNDPNSPDGGTVLRRVLQTWQQRAPVSWWTGSAGAAPPNDPRVVETVTTLADTNQVSKRTFAYDQHNNVTDTWEYHFGVGAPGPLIRRMHTDYVTFNNGVNYAADTNIHIRNLPLQTQVFDAGGIKRAETFYEYDLYDNSPNHAPLTDRPNISGHDGAFGAGYIRRGNVTKTSGALLNNSGGVTGWVNSHAQYDTAGSVVKAIDAKGIATQFDLRDNFGPPDDPMVQSGENPVNNAPGELGGQMSYAFLFKITNALGHKAYTKYDYYLGGAVLSEDINNIKSSVYFDDELDRPTRGVVAIGTAVASQTVIVYNDSGSPVNGYPARSITTISDKDVFGESNGGNGLKSVVLYDGLGRTPRKAAFEDGSWSITDTQFDALGRVSQVSNPYHATDPSSASPPVGLWTTTDYDALGRTIRVTTPDGAHVDMAYNGNQVTAIDPAGKKRSNKTDAAGRLVEVIEDPGGLGYVTTYVYDPMNNLRHVNQSGQGRWFSYDSLSRLIRVRNMEQDWNPNLPPHTDPFTGGANWAMAYSYDANGNLVSKTDARNITTTYSYDGLDRSTTVDYSNTAINPDILRQYDGATNGKGRFWADYAGGINPTDQEGEHNVIGSYDALGRPLTKHHLFKVTGVWSMPYSVSQTYDLAGNVKRVTYPSGRYVDYSYDQAGRLSSFSGNLGGSTRAYSDMIKYNAAGQMIKERFGTNTLLYHNLHYNNRQQVVDTRVGDSDTDEWSWNRGAISFQYGTADNNGNLRQQNTWVPLAGGGHVISQDNYSYDGVNRINLFTETQMNSSGQWIPNVAEQNFIYDPFGNRKITSASGGGVSNYNPSYDLSTNRINGLSYDAAGNIISDPLTGGTMTYDAEGRLRTATSGGGGTYVYDADGKRMRRITSEGEIWQVYGFGDELLVEYESEAQPTAPLKEYGYRGGQLLIIAESGSGGGVSFVKPALKPSDDLIGKAGLEADGDADGLFVVDEAVADLEFDEDSSLTTADVSSDNNTETLIDGVTKTIAKAYGNAPSANGVGGELLAEHPASATPSVPQKEYGYRSGLSLVPMLSVVSVDPGANQSPDPGQSGTLAVTGISPTGHASTLTTIGASDFHTNPPQIKSQKKSARWSAFPSVSGTIVSLKLKFNWTANGSVSAGVDTSGSASASLSFSVLYSVDGGVNWTSALSKSRSVSAGPGQSPSASINNESGSVEVTLSNSQDISLVQVRDLMTTNANANAPSGGEASAGANITTTISAICLEVETDTTAPVISNVAAGGITTSSATITWNTNEDSDSQVEYRTSTGSWQPTTLNPVRETAHSQGLSGLTPGTPYYYRVLSRDASDNLATSAEFTFITAPDTTPPTVTSFSPAEGASKVNANANMIVTFSEAMDAATLNGLTVELLDPSNALVSATVSYNAALFTATLNPTAPLTVGVTYIARVRGGGAGVKDAAGNALAADRTWTFTTGLGGIKWLVTDHLGSTRMVIYETGSLADISRHDFAPFGEELFAGEGIRSASNGYGDDSTRQKFTGYEREDEIRLDYAQARYFAWMQGRFTSPDSVSGTISNPQTLNLYAYVQNNPLAFVDPTGHYSVDGGFGPTSAGGGYGGPLTSTHTDRDGNVVAVYDDGDLGVYRHDDLSRWNGTSTLPRSGAGVTRMGETEIWDEFREHHDQTGEIMPNVAEDARIIFETSFDQDVERLNRESWNRSLAEAARESHGGRTYDIKTNTTIAPHGPNTGRLLNGKYATARTAGNYLAGMNGATGQLFGQYIDGTTMMKLAGALHQKKFDIWNATRIVYGGTSFGPAPWYGENGYAGRSIQAGFRRGESLRPQIPTRTQAIRCPKC